MLQAVPTACRSCVSESKCSVSQKMSKLEASNKLREDLKAWQRAKREQLEKEHPKKSSKPGWKVISSRPGGFGVAGELLQAARKMPRSLKSPSGRAGNPTKSSTCLQEIRSNSGYGQVASPPAAVATEKPSTLSEETQQFFEMCLGGPDVLFEHEVELEQQATTSIGEIEPDLEPESAAEFAICDSDSEDSDDSNSSGEGLDLEDMFAFDPEALAELVRKGASKGELAEQLRRSYAGALERRLSIADNDLVSAEAMVDSADPSSQSSTPRPTAGDRKSVV